MLSLRLHPSDLSPVADGPATAIGRAAYTALSVALHASLVVGAVALNDRIHDAGDPSTAIRNAAYLAPPDRHLASRGTVERVRYIRTDLSEGVPARTDRPGPAPRALKVQLATSNEQPSLSTVMTADPDQGIDSVYSILDVDTAARRYPWSAAPIYPRTLLEKGIEGAVVAEYVVDTSGVADTASFRVFNSTHAEFADAVRSALPKMRFAPAKIGPLAVRLLVQQTFTFRVQQPETAKDTTTRMTAGPRVPPPAKPPPRG